MGHAVTKLTDARGGGQHHDMLIVHGPQKLSNMSNKDSFSGNKHVAIASMSAVI